MVSRYAGAGHGRVVQPLRATSRLRVKRAGRRRSGANRRCGDIAGSEAARGSPRRASVATATNRSARQCPSQVPRSGSLRHRSDRRPFLQDPHTTRSRFRTTACDPRRGGSVCAASSEGPRARGCAAEASRDAPRLRGTGGGATGRAPRPVDAWRDAMAPLSRGRWRRVVRAGRHPNARGRAIDPCLGVPHRRGGRLVATACGPHRRGRRADGRGPTPRRCGRTGVANERPAHRVGPPAVGSSRVQSPCGQRADRSTRGPHRRGSAADRTVGCSHRVGA